MASTISVLPKIAGVVDGRVKTLIDGGIRSGTDLLRALALGADGAMMGRPYAFALAGGGEAGMRSMLAALKAEFHVSMALVGLSEANEIDHESIDCFPQEWL